MFPFFILIYALIKRTGLSVSNCLRYSIAYELLNRPFSVGCDTFELNDRLSETELEAYLC